MREIKEKIAYLQGLSEGLNISNDSKEGRVLNGIFDVLENFVDILEDMGDAQSNLEEYVETIDEDLYDLEDEIYDDLETDLENDLDDSDIEFIEVECPKCEEIVCFESDILDDEDYIEVTCPNCDEIVFTNDDTLEDSLDDEVYVNHTADNNLSIEPHKVLKGSIKHHSFDI